MTKNLFSIILLAFLGLNAVTLSAKKCVDDPNYFTISSCYQTANGAPYYLQTGGGNGNANVTKKFRFLKNGGAPKTINVKVHNPYNIETVWAYGTDDFNQSFYATGDINGNIIIPAEVNKISINADFVGGGVNLGLNPVEIEFVEPEFNFFNPATDDGHFCFSSILNFTSNLDGLCNVEFQLTCPNPPSNSGIPPGFSTPYIKSGSGFSVPTNEDFCNGELQPLVPQKCVTFNINIRINPCTPSDDPDNEPCPPLVLNQNIELCCWCSQIIRPE